MAVTLRRSRERKFDKEMAKSLEEWVLKVRDSYPLCTICREPLPVTRWKKGVHVSCEEREERIQHRTKYEEANAQSTTTYDYEGASRCSSIR